MRFKSFQIGKSKDKPENDAEDNDTLVTQITNLEEQVSGKTQELEEAEQQLKELSSIMQESEATKGASSQAHGPLDELTIEPGDQSLNLGEDTDDSNLIEEFDEETPVVEVIKAESLAVTEDQKEAEATASTEDQKEAQATASTEAEAEKEASDQAEDDSLSSLFSQEEEEVNPLASLIGSLPDVTPQELLEDLNEVKEIMGEWRQQ
jgi:nitrate/nitrite-specific signal transduction histidine kinase